MRRFLRFPNPVNEIAARTVAVGVVVQTVLFVATGWRPLLIPLAYGFLARVLSGPTFSPLGRLATQVIVPRLPFAERPVPGPPKRFAQGIGAALSISALVAAYPFGSVTAARVLVALIVVAASLEGFAGFCLGCTIFGWLMRAGVIPASVCESCADVRPRLEAALRAQQGAAAGPAEAAADQGEPVAAP